MSDPSERIIGHMNEDHQLALSDYLVHYGKVQDSNLDETTAQISRLDLESFEIEYSTSRGVQHTKTLVWSEIKEGDDVKEWRDIKDKLVTMAKHSASERGYSHQKIDKVLLPKVYSAWMYAAVAVLLYASYDLKGLKTLVKNDSLLQSIAPHIPVIATKYLDLIGSKAGQILGVLGVIHVIEFFVVSNPLFVKYRVPGWKRVAWSFMAIIEGFPANLRFKSLIQKH